MPELFLELFSEEIPARMQARAAEDLARLVGEALAPLAPPACARFHGPRRIALAAEVAPGSPGAAASSAGRAPMRPSRRSRASCASTAPRATQLRREGDYWVLDRASAGSRRGDADRRARMPPLLRRFPVAEIDALGRHERLHLGPPAAPDRLPAGRRGGAVRPARRRGRRARPRERRSHRGPPLPVARRVRGHLVRRTGRRSCARATCWSMRPNASASSPNGVAAACRRARARGGRRPRAARRGRRAGRVAGAAARAHRRRVHGPAAGGDAGLDAGEPALFRAARRGRARRRRSSPSSPTSRPPTAARAIVAGNERVLRARFADARHFWDLDRRTPLAEPRAGARRDHVPRQARQPGRAGAAASSGWPATSRQLVGADAALAERAAHAGQGRPRHRHGRRVPRIAGRDGPLLRPARRRAGRGRRRDPRPLRPEGSVRCGAGRAGRRSRWRWPTSSTSWPASSPSARSRPARATRTRCAARHSGSIRIIRENRLRLRAAAADRQAAGESCQSARSGRGWSATIAIEYSTSWPSGCASSSAPRAPGTTCWRPCSRAGADDDIIRLLARTEAVAGLLGDRGRRQPARRLSPCRQHPAHRGAKDGPHDGAARCRRCSSSTRSEALAAATRRDRRRYACRLQRGGLRLRDGGDGDTAAAARRVFRQGDGERTREPEIAATVCVCCPRCGPRWTASPISPGSKADP